MPFGTITSTESTFGSISGSIVGAVPGTLSGSVGVPGPQGVQGPQGIQGPPGPPGEGGTWGSIVGTLSNQTDLQTALNLKANLASPAFTGDPTAPTASLGDNDTSLATTAFVQQELASGTAVAKNLEVYVRNQTGSTLAAGSIVYVSGATGNLPLVTLAQGNNDANSAQTMGFVKTAIANNGTGFVIVRGIIENLDTSALTEGVQLYLSPTTPGAWTTTKPVAPNHMVYVGIVIRSHPTQGTILVAVQNGLELEELHDVLITSPTNGQVLKYDSVSGLWKNGTDVGGVAWGGITGTLSSQTDLQSALDSKYSTTNPAGYITSSALTGYATESWVTSQGYETAANAAATYYPLTNPAGYLTSSALTGYATESWVTAGFYPLTGNPSSFLVAADITGKANLSGATFTGLVGTVASATTGAGLNIPHGAAPTTPVNGDIWTTTSGLFARINAGTQQFAPLGSNNTFSNASSTYGSSTATGTIGLASGATISGSTKTLNIGTGGVSGSTTLTTIGPVLGASTTSIGNTTAASTLNLATGATLTATTKAVNIGTSGVAGSTTNIAIGSTTGTSTTTLQGTTNGVTVAADTNSTALATTAYVVGQAGSATPLVNGTAAVGTSLRYARQDHVHPTDTSRAALASPAFTGTPTAPTASPGTNTTQIATTAFVQQEVPAASTTAAGKVELATNAEVITGTSTTLALVPGHAGFLKADPRLRSLSFFNGTSISGSGALASSTGQTFSRQAYLASLATGRSCFIFGGIGSINAGFGTSTTKADQVDFSKKLWLSGYACMGFGGATSYLGDANTICRITLGGYSTNTTGDMTLRGIGLKKVGGASSTVSLTVHNGTTLTDVASTVTVPDGGGIHWLIYSDGTGNVTLYINGTQAATTTAGPTSATASGNACYREQVEATATPGVRQAMNCNGGWLYIE